MCLHENQLLSVVAVPALLMGCVLLSAIAATPQRAAGVALVPRIVERSDLAVANAADAVVHQTSWLLGPAIGAALTSASSPSFAMFVNALTFVAAAYCLTRVRLREVSLRTPATNRVLPNDDTDPGNQVHEATDYSPKRFVARTLEGVGAIKESKALRSVTLLLAGSLFIFGAEEVFTVLFAVDRLNLGDAGAGYLMTAIGVGGLLAAPLVSRFTPSPANVGRIMLTTGAMLSLPLCVFAITREPVVALAVMLVEDAGTMAGAAQLVGAAAAPLLVSGFRLTAAALTVGAIVAACTLWGAALLQANRNPRPL